VCAGGEKGSVRIEGARTLAEKSGGEESYVGGRGGGLI